MFTPIGFFAPTGGGSGIPVDGYEFLFDFKNQSTLTLDGTTITSVTDEAGVYTFTNNGTKPEWNSAGYIDGAGSTSGWGLIDDSNDIATYFENQGGIGSATWTLMIITSESPDRAFPFGMRLSTTDGGSYGKRWDMFYNDSTGRRDMIFAGQTFVSGITNDNTKDTLLFGEVNPTTTILYRWGTSESSGDRFWGTPSVDADKSKIGITARYTNLPNAGFEGKIYAIALWRDALDSTQRESLKDWAVDYYGLTLQS